MSTDRLMRLREVMDATGLGSSTIYRYIHAGTFPAPVKIGGFTARWRQSAVSSWMDGLTSGMIAGRLDRPVEPEKAHSLPQSS